jgi:hypothetical protein
MIRLSVLVPSVNSDGSIVYSFKQDDSLIMLALRIGLSGSNADLWISMRLKASFWVILRDLKACVIRGLVSSFKVSPASDAIDYSSDRSSLSVMCLSVDMTESRIRELLNRVLFWTLALIIPNPAILRTVEFGFRFGFLIALVNSF